MRSFHLKVLLRAEFLIDDAELNTEEQRLAESQAASVVQQPAVTVRPCACLHLYCSVLLLQLDRSSAFRRAGTASPAFVTVDDASHRLPQAQATQLHLDPGMRTLPEGALDDPTTAPALPGPVGLCNTSNTCFFNAFIQVRCSLP